MATDSIDPGGDWLVPRATGPVRAVMRLPGSKSMTNRALVLAALSDRPTVINGPLVARDTQLMAGALLALGCQIDQGPRAWRVEPAQLAGAGLPADKLPGPSEPVGRASITIDVGNAGTVLRFIPPVAALTRADVTFRGDQRMSQRPVAPLLEALRQLGGEVSVPGSGAVPFVVHGRSSLPGGAVTLDASASSQFISGLLLAAARFESGAVITHDGPAVPSSPHIEMTVRMLAACGVDVEAGNPATGSGSARGTLSWRVMPGPVSPGQIDVEPDLSNAVPFLAAALVTGGEVTVADWPHDSLQPARKIMELLTDMGADVRRTDQGLQVTGSGEIRGVRADLSEVGELTPVFAALASLAGSPSELTGVSHVRKHETDRLAALATEIGKLGGDITELDDGLRIRPARLSGTGVVFDSHDDHRLVMAAAVLGLAASGLQVRNAATVGKTFPEFGQFWARILAPAG
jgi:3-phosphoshikimate 1-carboxyvinyltransferase